MPEADAIAAPVRKESAAQTHSHVVRGAILAKKKPAELDMGEGSREQGFRLFGCR